MNLFVLVGILCKNVPSGDLSADLTIVSLIDVMVQRLSRAAFVFGAAFVLVLLFDS